MAKACLAASGSDDDAWRGFERIGSVLSLAPAHIEKYFAAGDIILDEAFPTKPAKTTKPMKAPETYEYLRPALIMRNGPNDWARPTTCPKRRLPRHLDCRLTCVTLQITLKS